MLSDKELKMYAVKSGKNINELKKFWDKAEKESSSMGKAGDDKYTTSVFETLIDLDENVNIELLTKKFIESEHTNFDTFIEELTMSDIPLDVRPEMSIEGTVENEIDTTEDNDETNFDSEGLLEDEVEEQLTYSKDEPDLILDIDDEAKKSKELLVDND